MLQLRESDNEVSEANTDASEESITKSETDEPVTTTNTVTHETLQKTNSQKLTTHAVRDCANLDSVSITKDHLSLAILDIRQCPKIVSFPERGLPLATPNLKLFVILDWKILKVIPNLRHSLSFLTELFIQECPKLVSTPGSFPGTLRKLSIVSCHKFRPRRDWRLHKLENLRSLINIEDG
ncbi:hypothetical protein KPL71_009471 [Citrus sinensis]|uniref:Uncharacterized protein n=1 Tax=Citrus sinensis TaxID=2711 RepID=A0ACB8ME17_CITSI|nr:hypothetical protein KPL71_009471 [Citrus sinensis]